MGGKKRYRFVLVEEPDETLPVRYQPPWRPVAPPIWLHAPDPMEALLEALLLLDRRGEGSEAWAPVLADNPLSFVLDALEEGVSVRRPDGRLLYANRAARELQVLRLSKAVEPLDELEVEDHRYRRRRMIYRWGTTELVIEVTQRLR